MLGWRTSGYRGNGYCECSAFDSQVASSELKLNLSSLLRLPPARNNHHSHRYHRSAHLLRRLHHRRSSLGLQFVLISLRSRFWANALLTSTRLLFPLFLSGIRKHEPQLWYANGGGNTNWKRLFWAMMYTCIGFLVRPLLLFPFPRRVELTVPPSLLSLPSHRSDPSSDPSSSLKDTLDTSFVPFPLSLPSSQNIFADFLPLLLLFPNRPLTKPTSTASTPCPYSSLSSPTSSSTLGCSSVPKRSIPSRRETSLSRRPE